MLEPKRMNCSCRHVIHLLAYLTKNNFDPYALIPAIEWSGGRAVLILRSQTQSIQQWQQFRTFCVGEVSSGAISCQVLVLGPSKGPSIFFGVGFENQVLCCAISMKHGPRIIHPVRVVGCESLKCTLFLVFGDKKMRFRWIMDIVGEGLKPAATFAQC
jgi:hypothetical protein